jgi:THAP4-like, heme-binding beta-barrel domain
VHLANSVGVSTVRLHPDLEPLAFLLGTWTGEGKGEYPTIEPFAYTEEATFTHSGRPLMSYLQRTWSALDSSAMHSESGFLRPVSTGAIELVIAHAFGSVEVSEGSKHEQRIELTSRALVPTSTAQKIEAVRRVIEVEADSMTYRVDMATSGHPLQQHLLATLKRTG